MIRIERPDDGPAVLAAGAPLVEAMCARVEQHPDTAGRGEDSFTFDNSIYGHAEVKQALSRAQHDKCAYCEGLFRAFGYGDIEHFRPKGFSQQAKGAKRQYPGYFWLAYTWENLLLSCELCNRARKRNLFPLRDPRRRASGSAELDREEPLLIDPSGPEDPRDHIRFNKNIPEALSDRGEASIEVYYLSRTYLNGLRADHLRRVQTLAQIVALSARETNAELAVLAAEAEQELEELVSPSAPFSAMVRDYLGR